MPRYFFDTANGERARDSEGTELANAHQARVHAIKFAGQCVADDPDLLGATDFRVEVRNQDDLLLFTITTFVTQAPAVARAARQER